MLRALRSLLVLSVTPSPAQAGAYCWAIHTREGKRIAASPYAFASQRGAELSGDCWLVELAGRE